VRDGLAESGPGITHGVAILGAGAEASQRTPKNA
jgi:hypothetical protein